MDISGKTKICGLIGNPVEHSFSPFIHNTISEKLGIDMVYGTFCVKDDLEAAVKGGYELGIQGFNVTVPHKQNVINALAKVDDIAGMIGAVNTLVRVDGGYKGYNTDIIGFVRELDDAGIDICANTFFIIGAGGAARAIAYILAYSKAKDIYMYNRTKEKALDIQEHIYSNLGVKIHVVDTPYVEGLTDYVAVQTTSVGLSPKVDEMPVTDERFYDAAKCGVDIIYNPFETAFMKQFAKRGKSSYNGLAMLLYQAVAAYELWNGCEVDSVVVKETYDLLRKKLGL